MSTTISYSIPHYRSTVDVTDDKCPEPLKLKAAVQTVIDTLATAHITKWVRVPIALAANGTWATNAEIPEGGTVTGIVVMSPTAFATGTITLAVKKSSSAGNTMLSAATYDLTALVAATRTAMTLTSTAADLVIAANGQVYIAVVSNNGASTGPADAAATVLIFYTATAP